MPAGPMVEPCIYRDLSDEAFRLTPAHREIREEVWLCNWPTTLAGTPPWHKRLVGPGLMIHPERDCIGCDVRKE